MINFSDNLIGIRQWCSSINYFFCRLLAQYCKPSAVDIVHFVVTSCMIINLSNINRVVYKGNVVCVHLFYMGQPAKTWSLVFIARTEIANVKHEPQENILPRIRCNVLRDFPGIRDIIESTYYNTCMKQCRYWSNADTDLWLVTLFHVVRILCSRWLLLVTWFK